MSKHSLPLAFQSASKKQAAWSILSTDTQHSHDIALIGVGDCMVEESLNAKKLIQEHNNVSVQVVAVDEMTMLDRLTHPDRAAFEESIKSSLSHVWSYIGHPKTIKGYLWDSGMPPQSSSVVGYRDKGASEAGLDRFAENRASRYDIAQEAIKNLNFMTGGNSVKKLTEIERYQPKIRII